MDLNVVYNEDCIGPKGMSLLPDKSVDMIICDPPYGQTPLDWDQRLPFDNLWLHYRRIAKKNTAIVIFGQEPFSSLVRLSNLKYYRYDWYWQKERLTNVFQVKRRPGKVIECISVFYQQQSVYIPQKTFHNGKIVTNRIGKNGSFSKVIDSKEKHPYTYRDDSTRYPLQILKFNREVSGKAIHPTQKPVALFEYLIKTYTNEGAVVLDNVMGSGTTAIACMNTNRYYIGYENDPEMYQKMMQRINEHKEKLRQDGNTTT